MYKAFKMKLYPGCEAEYERRHNELWPEMKEMEERITLSFWTGRH